MKEFMKQLNIELAKYDDDDKVSIRDFKCIVENATSNAIEALDATV